MSIRPRTLSAAAALLIAPTIAAAEPAGKESRRANPPANIQVYGQPFNFSFFGGNGRLGAQVGTMTDALRATFGAPEGRGILVQELVPGSAGEKAGLKAGDVILSLDGEPVGEPSDIIQLLSTKQGAVKLEIVRNKQKQTLTATLDQTPLAGSAWQNSMFQVPDARVESLQKRVEELEKRLGELEKKKTF